MRLNDLLNVRWLMHLIFIWFFLLGTPLIIPYVYSTNFWILPLSSCNNKVTICVCACVRACGVYALKITRKICLREREECACVCVCVTIIGLRERERKVYCYCCCFLLDSEKEKKDKFRFWSHGYTDTKGITKRFIISMSIISMILLSSWGRQR